MEREAEILRFEFRREGQEAFDKELHFDGGSLHSIVVGEVSKQHRVWKDRRDNICLVVQAPFQLIPGLWGGAE